MVALITEHIATWSAAQIPKTNGGRGRGRGANGQSPHGIKKLRELILELAVRGKLVPQDPNDEPASVLLAKIAKEKARLIKEEKIKKEKPLSEIRENEKPFELPKSWEWVRLQDISTYIQRGKGPTYSDQGKVQVISQKCIQWSGFDISKARFVEDSSLKAYQSERFLECNDLLWNSTGTGTVGRINVLRDVEPNSLIADSHVTVIRPLQVSCSFLWCFVAAPGIQIRIEPEHDNSLVSGTTNQVELNTSAVQTLLVPVPPLAEQHRIVAKVDELMALCDKLEQQQTDSNETHQTLVENLLATLTTIAGQAEFAEAWQRISNHFDTLFTTEQSIDQLKQTILQLAVMGKLVSQDPNDEPASVLLQKIAKGKARLIKEGKIRKQKPLPKIIEVEKPFELPKSWEWTRLGTISQINPRNEAEDQLTVSFVPMPLITTSHTGEHGQEIKTWGEIKKGYTHFANGDIGVAKITPCFENSKAVVFSDLENGLGAGTTELHISRPFGSTLAQLYILLFLKAPQFLHVGETKMTGTAGQKRVPKEFFSESPLPLPPLAEQHRIVAKVDELMALCDTLKARLNDAQTTQIQLSDAIVEQAVA